MSDHDDEQVQCDHSKGLAKAKDIDIIDDPMMQQSEWSLQDWNHIYGQESSSQKKGKPTAELVKYMKELLPSEPARVLLPLCGKSPDLRWLYERGNSVVGLEGVEKPVEAFFNLYPDLAHSVTELPYGKLYKSQDERLQIYVCDVLAVPSGALGKFDAVFDWGAYTAIRPADRPKYSEVVVDTLKDDTRYFLEVCHDAPPDAVGLPHSVPFRTVKLELGQGKKMTILSTSDVSEEWGVETYFNSHILFTPAN